VHAQAFFFAVGCGRVVTGQPLTTLNHCTPTGLERSAVMPL